MWQWHQDSWAYYYYYYFLITRIGIWIESQNSLNFIWTIQECQFHLKICFLFSVSRTRHWRTMQLGMQDDRASLSRGLILALLAYDSWVWYRSLHCSIIGIQSLKINYRFDTDRDCATPNFRCVVIEIFQVSTLQVLGYSDTDVAEYLYSSQPHIDSLVNFLCKDLTKACSTKPPPVPKVNDFIIQYQAIPIFFKVSHTLGVILWGINQCCHWFWTIKPFHSVIYTFKHSHFWGFSFKCY